uniref:Uncharacterized protein n=1 Tax=Acrobeloides nanus TaxID=290746 RepID=A0A914EJG7_9BILA
MYADNAIHDTKDEADALEKYRESKEIFRKAGMNMREYLSSIPGVTEKFPKEDQAKNQTDPKILGVKWDIVTDTLSISTSADHRIQPKGRKAKRHYDHLPERATRRMVLAFIGAIFDPLGLLSPAIFPCTISAQTN